MKKYEGLFILNIPHREDGVKEIIDKISEEIAAAGGKVLTVQKMEKRSFSRVANRRFSSGYYANFIFEANAAAVRALQGRFSMNPDVFRVLFTQAPQASEAAAAVAT